MKGVSELISILIIVLISFTGIGIALLVGNPVIDRAKESAVVNEAIENMKILDNLIREVASEGRGSFRTVQLKISGGEYKIDQKTNSIEFTDVIKSGIITSGTFIKEGNVFIAAGTNAKATTYDLDLDGTTDMVLENEIMRVALLNNATNGNGINTSKAVKFFNLKSTDGNISINDSSVIIENLTTSYYGTGFTELVKTGDNLPVAQAIIHVNISAPSNLTYDIVYTLRAGADFLIVKVQNISNYVNNSNIPTFVKYNFIYKIGNPKTNDAYDIGTINESINARNVTKQFSTLDVNLTKKYVCTYNISSDTNTLLLSLLHSGKSDRLDYVNFTSIISDTNNNNTYFTAIRQKIVGSNLIIAFTKEPCKTISDNYYLVSGQDIPSKPFSTYKLGGVDIPIQIYTTYDRLQINGTDRFRSGSYKICLSNEGTTGGKPLIFGRLC